MGVESGKQRKNGDFRRRLQSAADEALAAVRPATVNSGIVFVLNKLRDIKGKRGSPIVKAGGDR